MPIVRPTCTLHAHSRCSQKKEKSIGEMDLCRIVGQVVNRMFINYNPWRKSATRGRSMKKYWLGSLITGSVSIYLDIWGIRFKFLWLLRSCCLGASDLIYMLTMYFVSGNGGWSLAVVRWTDGALLVLPLMLSVVWSLFIMFRFYIFLVICDHCKKKTSLLFCSVLNHTQFICHKIKLFEILIH